MENSKAISVYTKQMMRFLRRVSHASSQADNWQEFVEVATLAYDKLKDINKPTIYSNYYTQMIDLSDSVVAKISAVQGDLSEFGAWINKELNMLEKTKRSKSYNRGADKKYRDEEWE